MLIPKCEGCPHLTKEDPFNSFKCTLWKSFLSSESSGMYAPSTAWSICSLSGSLMGVSGALTVLEQRRGIHGQVSSWF